MRALSRLFFLMLAVFLLASCSSGDKSDEDDSSGGNPRVEAYAADAFNYGAPIPKHVQKDAQRPFFHKQCNPAGEPSYYSKTSFMCESLTAF